MPGFTFKTNHFAERRINFILSSIKEPSALRFSKKRNNSSPRKRLPRLPNGKLDYKKIASISASHKKHFLELARSKCAKKVRASLRHRYNIRQSYKLLNASVHPYIETYADAVKFAVPTPTLELPRYKPSDFLEVCVCKCCAITAQAAKARSNAFLKREEARSAAREVDRINRRMRRLYCRPVSPTVYRDAVEIANLLASDYVATESTPEVRGKVVATSVKQVKTSWRHRTQSFDWAEFYTGEFTSSPEESRSPKRRALRKERATSPQERCEARVALPPPSGDSTSSRRREFLKPAALARLANRVNPFDNWVDTRTRCVLLPGERPLVTQMADSEVNVESKEGNVVLQEAVEPEVEVIGHQLTSLRKYCQADTSSLPSDMDRWIPISSFTWETSKDAGHSIAAYSLPSDALCKTDAEGKQTWKDNVMTNMMRVRQFVQTDLEVRVILNSAPFNLGQLQLAVFYQGLADKYYDLRLNNSGLSQTDHVIVDASQANSGSLIIPYRSYRPYMPIYASKTMGWNAYFCDVRLMVLNPLVIPAGGPSSVDGTVLVRFTNCVLTGMIPPGLTPYQTQMFSMMSAAAAAQWLYQRYADPNRDAPPNPHAPAPVAPDAVGNLSCGTNYVEPLHSLRLDPKGQTPHPEGVPDEMTVPYVASKFGFIETLKVAATLESGKRIFCYDAAPILSLSHYAKTVRSGINCYHLPPVAVLSQMFAYWRGEIEYRFDFVATRYHQMRLYFAWVPGYSGSTLTLEQAYSCAGTYFDLKEDNRSLTIKVPYIADKPWWPHRFANGVDAEEIAAPGVFCCFVVNRLTYTSTVPNSISINVYMRGGANFELAVPIQPTIGLSYVPDFANAADVVVQAVPGYFPWYAGTWYRVEASRKLLLRYGAVSDHVAQFYGLKPLNYYKIKDQKIAATVKYTTKTGQVDGKDWILVPIDLNDGYGLTYLGLYPATELANIKDYFYVKTGSRWLPRKPTAYNYDSLVDSEGLTDNPYYSPTDVNALLVPTAVPAPAGDDDEVSSESSIEYLGTQGDNRDKVEGVIKFETMSLIDASRETFGEDFSSLKDLCRRYQPYLQMPVGPIGNLPGAVNFAFPMVPGGLDLHPLVNPFTNSCREGIIPIILSGFRFFRGGLRFKFVPSVTDVVVYVVQVKPDRSLRACIPRAGGSTIADSFIQHGYATSAQCSSVNPVLSVEVPFYIPGSAGLLCRPSDAALSEGRMARFFSLGELAVSCQAPSYAAKHMTDAAFTVMYALADDFSAHTFQGFPPVVFVKEAKTG